LDVVVLHFGVAIKAERNAIVEIIRSTFVAWNDVMEFDFYAAELMTETAMAATGDEGTLGGT
jgi:hypothetical protein